MTSVDLFLWGKTPPNTHVTVELY